MNVCYLSLGSNQKFPERQIRAALRAIRNLPCTSVLDVAGLYWNKAWGLQVQQDFCNTMIKITTTLSPQALLKQCQNIENRQGRVRRRPWGPRTLDIDIIFYASRTIKKHNLIIPHPCHQDRDFVLIPLKQIGRVIPPRASSIC